MKRYTLPIVILITIAGLVFAIVSTNQPVSTLDTALSRLNIENQINTMRVSAPALADSVPLDRLAEETQTNPKFTPDQAETFLTQNGYTPIVLKAMYADSVLDVTDLINKLTQQQSDTLHDLLSNPQYKDIGVYIGAEVGGDNNRRSVEIVYGAQE